MHIHIYVYSQVGNGMVTGLKRMVYLLHKTIRTKKIPTAASDDIIDPVRKSSTVNVQFTESPLR